MYYNNCCRYNIIIKNVPNKLEQHKAQAIRPLKVFNEDNNCMDKKIIKLT